MLRLNLRQLRCAGILLLFSAVLSLLLLLNLPTHQPSDVVVSLAVVDRGWKKEENVSATKRQAETSNQTEQPTLLSTRSSPKPFITALKRKEETNPKVNISAAAMKPQWGKQKIPDYTLPGFLNVHIWDGWCGSSIKDIRNNKHFPSYPDHHTIINSTYASWKDTQYGQRIFGYIHPPVTGSYAFAMRSDDDSETWLSSSEHPADVKQIVYIHHDTGEWLDYGDKAKVVHVSHEISLVHGRKYFIEILHKQSAYRDYVILGWKIPGKQKYSLLKPQCLSTYYDPNLIGQSIVNVSLHTPQTNASYGHYKHRHDFEIAEYWNKSRRLFLSRKLYQDNLKVCFYKPSYLIKFNLTRYQGVYLVHNTAVYPDDGTKIPEEWSIELCEENRLADSHGVVPSTPQPSTSPHLLATTNSEVDHRNTPFVKRKLLYSLLKSFKMKKWKDPFNGGVPKWHNKNSYAAEDLEFHYPEKHKKRKIFGLRWAFLEKDKVFRDEILYNYDASKCRNDGNVLLNGKIARYIARKYFSLIKDVEGKKLKLVKIVNVEENHDLMNGDRYLVELDVMRDGKVYRLSEYIYQPQGRSDLCQPQDFEWNHDATVHVIIPVKNQGKWLLHFISNMDKIFLRTGDTNFNVIIVDFNSNDIDLVSILKKASLKRYQVVNVDGPFQRAWGLQAGVEAVKDKNDIIFMCDLHLQMPDEIIEAIRKHCVQGKMAYAPIVNRLECGYNPETPRGSWEILGFGLFGMYKSDFDAVGGMNTKEFKTTWGGEDWELVDRVLQHGLEIERMRLPNFYHYHHSKKRMWNSNEQNV